MKRYEVLFKTGDGSWRRWALCKTLASAEKSLARLDEHMGAQLVQFGFTRIVEREERWKGEFA